MEKRFTLRGSYKRTQKQRDILRKRASGNSWCVGRKVSSETKEKMRLSMLKSEWHKRHKLPEAEKIARDKVRRTAKRLVYRILKMTRKRKDKKSEAMLGYSKNELRAHLEKQFRDGMAWDKNGSFHVDHIVPVAYFLDCGITDLATINALSNLQVLTPHENHKKSAHFSGGKVTYTNGLA